KDSRLPAQTGLAQALAKMLVEVQQAGFITQPLAIGRVAYQQTMLSLIRPRFEGSQLALVDFHPVSQSGPLDIVACRGNQTRVSLIATNPQRRLGQAGLGPRLRFFMQFLPKRRHM